MDIGKAIREIRKSKKINQGQLAVMIGIAQTSLCQLEKNAKNPHPKTMEKICRALGVTTGAIYIMALTDEDIPKDKLEIYNSIKPFIKNVFL